MMDDSPCSLNTDHFVQHVLLTESPLLYTLCTLLTPLSFLWHTRKNENFPALMGISLLWDSLQKHGKDVALPRLHEHVAKRRPPRDRVRIGVDISLWIVSAQHIVFKTPGVTVLRILFYRLCKAFSLPFLDFCFVFDGPNRPEWKRGKAGANAAAWDAGRLNKHTATIKLFVEAFGFAWVQASGEAEATLAHMCKQGAIDTVMSDDVDCFAFGAPSVVRNWSSALAGSKARFTYSKNRSRSTPGTEEDSSSSSSDLGSDTPASAENIDQTALRDKENLVTVYRNADMLGHLDDPGDFILCAVLAGGDYNAVGIRGFGMTIAIALARAGFGKRLLQGAKSHLSIVSPSDGASGRYGVNVKSGVLWSLFLDGWRTDLSQELLTNKHGYLDKKKASLARSDECKNMFSSKESIQVLASYIWPHVQFDESDKVLAPKKVNVERLAALLVQHFEHTPERVQEVMRNSIWTSCVARHLNGEVVNELWNLDVDQSDTNKTSSPSPIHPFFLDAGRTSSMGKQRSHERTNAVELPVQILKERKTASTGGLPEVYVEFDVRDLVPLAGKGAEEALQECLPQTSSQKSSQSSPKKPRVKAIDPMKPMRAWLPRQVFERSKVGKEALNLYEAKLLTKREKDEKTAVRKAKQMVQDKNQAKLNTFFQQKAKANGITSTAAKKSSSFLDELDALTNPPAVLDASVSSTKRRVADRGSSSPTKMTVNKSPTKKKILEKTKNTKSSTSGKKDSETIKTSLKRPVASKESSNNALHETSVITLSDDSIAYD